MPFIRRENLGERFSEEIDQMVPITRGVVRCSCNREVLCEDNTNTCECGADYNMSGQRLAPRSQWGEETGESVSDILRGDTDPWGN